MGDAIDYRCTKCRVSRREFVGTGFRGTGRELCACYRCKKLVLRPVRRRWPDDRRWTFLRCPDCRHKVVPIQDGDPCPVCERPVKIRGIMWWD